MQAGNESFDAKKPPQSTWFGRFARRYRQVVWMTDLRSMSKLRRSLVQSARIATRLGQDIWEGQLTLRAMSLVYTTLLSLVPLLAISFSVLKGFGVHREIRPFLITFLAPLGEKAEEIAVKFIEFIDNTNVSVLGYVGFCLLFYAVVSLMQKIERAFNYVWRVAEHRSVAQRIRDYLALIIIGPTLMFAATGMWATILATDAVTRLAGIVPLGWLIQSLTQALPVLLIIVAFTFVYMFVPNTKVRFRPALLGGLVAGMLWNVGGVSFAVFVENSANYPTIYSGFATAIFFMIWLYLAWMILLIGSSISFYAQNPQLAVAEPYTLSIRQNEKLALAVAAAIGKRFYRGEPPHSLESLSEVLAAPTSALTGVLQALERGGLVCRSEVSTFLPAIAWDQISVGALIERLRSDGESGDLDQLDVDGTGLRQAWNSYDSTVTRGVEGLDLKELALSETPGG